MPFVYIIQDAHYPAVKIGISKDPVQRLRILQADATGQLTLRYVYEDCYMAVDAIERIAKLRFIPVSHMTHWFRGLTAATEWFYISPRHAIEEIDRVLGVHVPWKRCAISDKARRTERANTKWKRELEKSQRAATARAAQETRE